jgi:ABC-type phosphate transport system substrate-binding protein
METVVQPQANLYSITFSDYASVRANGMSSAKMKNAAGRVVSPSTAAIQAAMTDFSASVKGGTSKGRLWTLFELHFFFTHFFSSSCSLSQAT